MHLTQWFEVEAHGAVEPSILLPEGQDVLLHESVHLRLEALRCGAFGKDEVPVAAHLSPTVHQLFLRLWRHAKQAEETTGRNMGVGSVVIDDASNCQRSPITFDELPHGLVASEHLVRHALGDDHIVRLVQSVRTAV